MKLLVSAYACEPGKGSEPAVGWDWVQALVRRGYRVHVVTRSNNREAIESYAAAHHPALTFHYYDLSGRSRAWKRRRGGIYLYYLLWQWGAYRLAARLHHVERFERVHHVTFASFRQPSFMGRLGIPFIFGPVGGGETMPASLRRGLPLRHRMAELVRNLGNALIGFDPLMRSTFSRAQTIACTTAETMARIPARFRAKCVVQPAIGINESEIHEPGAPEPALSLSKGLQVLETWDATDPKLSGAPGLDSETWDSAPHFLFVGRLLYWKGLHLAIRAMAQVRRSLPEVRLKIIGTGDDREWLESEAHSAGVADLLDWIPSKPHAEIAAEYRQSLALVFPSLHDSGGMVVLEALAAGLPVVCLDLGGPGTIAAADCAVIVAARQAGEAAIIDAIAQAMIRLATDAGFRARCASNAVQRARQLTWDRAADHLYAALH